MHQSMEVSGVRHKGVCSSWSSIMGMRESTGYSGGVFAHVLNIHAILCLVLHVRGQTTHFFPLALTCGVKLKKSDMRLFDKTAARSCVGRRSPGCLGLAYFSLDRVGENVISASSSSIRERGDGCLVFIMTTK